MAKFHGNLLKDSTLSLFNNANIIFPLVSQFDSKMPLVNFFLDTRYIIITTHWYIPHKSNQIKSIRNSLTTTRARTTTTKITTTT